MFTSINPYTQKENESFNSHSWKQIANKIELADKSFQSWKTTSVNHRIEKLHLIAHELRTNKDSFASILTREMGKLQSEAVGEIDKCAWLCDYYAANASAFLSPKTIETDYNKSYVTYQPLGIILGIMPWNFPFWQSFRFAVPAILSGNVVLLKPAPNVPQSGIALEEIFSKALERTGVFQTIFAEIPDIEKIINHDYVKGVSLTGSNKAGSAVASQSGAAIKKCLLELGGSDPFIVLEDADIDRAIEMGFASRMVNGGQTCISAKRFILHEKIADRFINGLKQKINNLNFGDPFLQETSLTVMARKDLVESLQEQVDKSIEMGASLLHKGGHQDKQSNLFLPMILGNIRKGMPAFEEELFGPVFSVFIFSTHQEAIELANDSIYGLGASVWSEDLDAAERMALELNVGAVAVNDMVKSDPRLPFGGVNQSGFGRELAEEGIREFVNVKSVVLKG